MAVPFWRSVSGGELAQGDYLPRCLVPLIPRDFGRTPAPTGFTIHIGDLIVLSQSCDLANMKNGLVALCPIRSLPVYESLYPQFSRKGAWEDVRKGRREGLHLLASTTTPEVGRSSLVVDFREIFSLPIGYLEEHAAAIGPRWRLESPYLEHFSQAFARFFMRVGLPSAIPPITD